MADQYVKLLEAVERKERITTNGSEIVITWYVEPYTAAPVVICALLGRVTGNTVNDTRVLPAFDHDMPWCYCVEARRTSIDRRVIAFSPSIVNLAGGAFGDEMETIRLALAQPIIMDGPQAVGASSKKDIKASAEFEQPDAPRGQAGAFIEAVYRPLPTVLNFSSTPTNEEKIHSFDCLDPQFQDMSRTIDTGAALRVVIQRKAGLGFGTKTGGDGLLVETWQEFTIRRIMCPSIPWRTINALANCVNGKEAWRAQDMVLPSLPGGVFPIGTLRFNGAEPIKRTMPDCLAQAGAPILTSDRIPTSRSMTWWDILLKFSWRTTVDYRYDLAGNRSGPVYIGWNDIWYSGGWDWTGILLDKLSAGWYQAGYFQEKAANVIPQQGSFRNKYPNAEDADVSLGFGQSPFDLLFLNTSP